MSKTKTNEANSKILDAAVKELVKDVFEYESDTFSSSEENMTQSEANKIALLLIEKIMLEIDGPAMDYYLNKVRKEQK